MSASRNAEADVSDASKGTSEQLTKVSEKLDALTAEFINLKHEVDQANKQTQIIKLQLEELWECSEQRHEQLADTDVKVRQLSQSTATLGEEEDATQQGDGTLPRGRSPRRLTPTPESPKITGQTPEGEKPEEDTPIFVAVAEISIPELPTPSNFRTWKTTVENIVAGVAPDPDHGHKRIRMV